MLWVAGNAAPTSVSVVTSVVPSTGPVTSGLLYLNRMGSPSRLLSRSWPIALPSLLVVKAVSLPFIWQPAKKLRTCKTQRHQRCRSSCACQVIIHVLMVVYGWFEGIFEFCRNHAARHRVNMPAYSCVCMCRLLVYTDGADSAWHFSSCMTDSADHQQCLRVLPCPKVQTF
jgi:hypothetical protein